MHYGSDWGFNSFQLTEGIQNGDIHFDWELHKCMSTAALTNEVTNSAKCKQYINMGKYWNILDIMPNLC